MKRVARESSTLFLYTAPSTDSSRLPWFPHIKDNDFLWEIQMFLRL
jgi:hypothetical protein